MRWRIPLVVTLALFVAVSCDQQPIEPSQQATVTSAEFDFSNGPPEPGNSFVVRDAYGDFWWLFEDENTGYLAVVTDQDWDCDGTWIDYDEVTVVPFQTIFNPSGEGLEMFFESGWLNASIFSAEDCSALVASGLVKNQWTDNDVYAWLYEHNRANPYGGGIHGTIDGYTLIFNVRCVWGGSTKEIGNPHCNSRVKIF